jgi:regulator of protease activity HflC (stomatin/prohibitin superfamily)
MDFTAYSFDAQNMSISATLQYEIDASHIIDIATRFGNNEELATRIRRITEEKMKTVLSAKSATKIIETRDQLGGELLKAVKTIEVDYYINVLVAVAPSITFSSEFEVAVENKMKAEQAKLQANYDKETAIIKAEQQLEVAHREADAAITKARGDAEALSIMTEAWAAISQTVKDAMIRQQFIEKWDGKMPQVISDGSMIYDLGLTGQNQTFE